MWPLSRETYPKQFLALNSKDTLFQQAVQRVQTCTADDIQLQDPLIVTNEAHRFLCQDQLPTEHKHSLLLEPTGKNTAPALTLAALEASQHEQDPILIVTPADQTITHLDHFTRSMQQCIRAAANGDILVMGITADRPETGYGYIQQTGEPGAHGDYLVKQFTEKPDQDTAQTYLDSGTYTWNSGIFVLRASTWLKAIQTFQPDMFSATQDAWRNRQADGSFVRPDPAKFSHIPSESIDYAVIEHCTHTPEAGFAIKMVPLDAGWSDLGVWSAVWDTSTKDEQNNATHGDVLLTNTQNSLVHATNRLVSVVGMDHLIVIETADAVLIANKHDSQAVKQIVTQLQALQRDETLLHRKVYRPWGWYDSIDEADRFKVKRIQVKPGASLSLQKHHHRAEHWIVVKGTAEVTCGDTITLLSENESTYIPLGETHRLANPGSIPLEIIEVQSGSYLGEDDIVRLDDHYGRQ